MKILLSLFCLLTTATALADFEADMEISSLKDGKLEKVMESKIQGKGDLNRLTIKKPMPMTMIVNRKTQSGHMLMEQQKMAMKTDMKKAGIDKQTKCAGEDVASCYKKEGFVHAGTETIEGVDCDIWTKTNEKEKNGFIKLWHPKVGIFQNKNEGMAMKMESYDKAGGTLQDMMLVKNFNSKAKISDDAFKIPAGYQIMDMSSMMGGGMGVGGKPGAGMPQGMPQGMPKMDPDMLKQMMKAQMKK